MTLDTNMSEQPIFRVTNHHTGACGRPPAIDDSEPNRYLGYFENEHGEQAIFVYDRARRAGTFWLGDAGWERSHPVVEGAVPGVGLGATERAWLAARWKAATLA
jgi:hypothetical protein